MNKINTIYTMQFLNDLFIEKAIENFKNNINYFSNIHNNYIDNRVYNLEIDEDMIDISTMEVKKYEKCLKYIQELQSVFI